MTSGRSNGSKSLRIYPRPGYSAVAWESGERLEIDTCRGRFLGAIPNSSRATVADGPVLLLRGAVLVPRRDEEGRNVTLEASNIDSRGEAVGTSFQRDKWQYHPRLAVLDRRSGAGTAVRRAGDQVSPLWRAFLLSPLEARIPQNDDGEI